MSGLKLYTYFRSSAAYRVRIALNLKGLNYTPVVVDLRNESGDQHRSAYRDLNPQGLVPTLLEDDFALSQSIAILEYLDEVCPHPPLLPADAQGRATVRSLAQVIACDIHPLNNLRVLNYLKNVMRQDEEARQVWYRHWIAEGFGAIERQLECYDSNRRFCYGDHPTLADICLVPQVYNARRFGCELQDYPQIVAIDHYCSSLSAFAKAAPERQADASVLSQKFIE